MAAIFAKHTKQQGFHSSLVLLWVFEYSSHQMYSRQHDSASGFNAHRQADIFGIQAER